MVDAWAWREERARRRDAWLLANMLQPWSKKRLRPDDFLRRPLSDYERQKEWESVAKKLDRLGIPKDEVH